MSQTFHTQHPSTRRTPQTYIGRQSHQRKFVHAGSETVQTRAQWEAQIRRAVRRGHVIVGSEVGVIEFDAFIARIESRQDGHGNVEVYGATDPHISSIRRWLDGGYEFQTAQGE